MKGTRRKLNFVFWLWENFFQFFYGKILKFEWVIDNLGKIIFLLCRKKEGKKYKSEGELFNCFPFLLAFVIVSRDLEKSLNPSADLNRKIARLELRLRTLFIGIESCFFDKFVYTPVVSRQ